MNPLQIFSIVKLVIRWLAAYGKCTKAKQAAGEVIDWSDRLECAVNALSGLEGEILPLIEQVQHKTQI